MTGAIHCEALTKRFGGFTALDRLDLDVPEGSVFGFLGPNGAGKTTTLKLLTGLTEPTSGTATIAGIPVDFESLPLRRIIGYLPEEAAFYPWMSGLETLRYVADLFGLTRGDGRARAGEVLETVGLEGAANRRVGAYSRGMRQRLGIAQALLNRPRVLFLDEPCSALDPVGRRDVLDLISRLHGQTTIFMSTHILSDVERVCDTVAIVNKGRLVKTDTVDALRRSVGRVPFHLRFEEDPTPFVLKLNGLKWVERWEVDEQRLDGPEVRVYPADLNIAKSELPKLAAGSGLTLLAYEMVPPTLEDVFISLVEDKKASP